MCDKEIQLLSSFVAQQSLTFIFGPSVTAMNHNTVHEAFLFTQV